MKHPFLFLLLACATLFTACKDDCEQNAESFREARAAFMENPNATTCASYQVALESFLLSGCEEVNGVNYKRIAEDELDSLNCSLYAAGCFNGVQDGDETGVDCGGSCLPCVSFPADSAVFTALVNGTLFDFANDIIIEAILDSNSRELLGGGTDISSGDSWDISIILSELPSSEPYTYTVVDTLTGAMNEATAYYGNSSSGQYFSFDNGTIEVSRYSRSTALAEGTFSFDLAKRIAPADTISITQGIFTLPIE